MGKLEDINPRQFLIYKNKLYVFRDRAMLEFFLNSPERTISEATARYFDFAKHRRYR